MRISQIEGLTVLEFPAEGPTLGADPRTVVEEAFGAGAEVVVVPAARLGDEFFDLSTRVAGEFTQKLVNYHIRLVVVGDISERIAASNALASYVVESNRRPEVAFVDTLADWRP